MGLVKRMPVWFTILIVAMYCSLAAFAAFAEKKVLILSSHNTSIYEDTRILFKYHLASHDSDLTTIHTVVLSESENYDDKVSHFSHAYDAILTLGIDAAKKAFLLSTNTPIVSVLIPKLAYSKLRKLEAKRLESEFDKFRTGIFLDQPFQRQLALAHFIDSRSEIAVFGESINSAAHSSIDKCFRPSRDDSFKKISVYHQSMSIKAIPTALDSTGIVVATPLFIKKMADNAKWLLYMAYQRNIPVIGYSPALVKAGAVAAVSSTADNIGQEAAEIINQILQSPRYPNIQARYPKYFSVHLNQRVAKSLGYVSLSVAELEKDLANLEASCNESTYPNKKQPKQRMTQLNNE